MNAIWWRLFGGGMDSLGRMRVYMYLYMYVLLLSIDMCGVYNEKSMTCRATSMDVLHIDCTCTCVYM